MRLDIFLQFGDHRVRPGVAGGFAVKVQLLQQQREEGLKIADDGLRRAGARGALLREDFADDEVAGDVQVRTPDLAAPAVGIDRIACTDDLARDADPQHVRALLRKGAPLQPVPLLAGDDAELVFRQDVAALADLQPAVTIELDRHFIVFMRFKGGEGVVAFRKGGLLRSVLRVKVDVILLQIFSRQVVAYMG